MWRKQRPMLNSELWRSVWEWALNPPMFEYWFLQSVELFGGLGSVTCWRKGVTGGRLALSLLYLLIRCELSATVPVSYLPSCFTFWNHKPPVNSSFYKSLWSQCLLTVIEKLLRQRHNTVPLQQTENSNFFQRLPTLFKFCTDNAVVHSHPSTPSQSKEILRQVPGY